MKILNMNYISYTDEAKAPVIVLPTCKGIMVIPVRQIIRIQSISNYSKLFFCDGKTLVVAKVLHWFQEQAGFSSFVRIHRSHFINTYYIKSYSSKPGVVLLHNNETIFVSRRKKAAFIKRIHILNSPFEETLPRNPVLNTKKIIAA